MSTFIVRATPRQRQVYRMIHGAVRNAVNAHPGWEFDPRFVGSITKRAAGTLVAGWPSVLAASAVSQADRGACRPDRLSQAYKAPASEGVGSTPKPAPFHPLQIAIGRMAQVARRSGQMDRYDALADALRVIGDWHAAPEATP